MYPQVTTGGPLLLEQAASATVRIRTPAVALPDAGVAATVDAVSAVTDTDVDEGDTALVLEAPAAWVRGRQYLLTLTTGEVFVVVAAKGGSSATLQLTEPLPCAALAGSTVQGYALTAALSPTQTLGVGEGLALWTAVTAAGDVYTFSQQFRVVLRIPTSPLTWTRLATTYPLVHTLRPARDQDGSETIRAVWDVRLLPALEAKGILAERIMSPERLEPVHMAMCVHHLLAQDPAREQGFVDTWERAASHALELALASKDLWIDVEAEDEVPRDEDAPPQPYTHQRWGR